MPGACRSHTFPRPVKSEEPERIVAKRSRRERAHRRQAYTRVVYANGAVSGPFRNRLIHNDFRSFRPGPHACCRQCYVGDLQMTVVWSVTKRTGISVCCSDVCPELTFIERRRLAS